MSFISAHNRQNCSAVYRQVYGQKTTGQKTTKNANPGQKTTKLVFLWSNLKSPD